MKTRETATLLAIAMLLSLSPGLGLAGAASTTDNIEDDGDEALGLKGVAALFSEQPIASPEGDGPEADAPTCGTPGHCNAVQCPDPGCDPDESAWCECEAAGFECEDDHNGIWPGGKDNHPVYDCACSCGGDPPEPPPDCTVYHPTTGECLVDALVLVPDADGA